MFGHINSGFENDLEPTEFYLSPNYPNPFREKTTIKYCVAQTTRVRLTVFDSEGKEIEKLVDEEKNPGTYEVEFSVCHSCESRNPMGGIYLYRLEAGDYKNEMKMELIK
jgi:hypothetical protein